MCLYVHTSMYWMGSDMDKSKLDVDEFVDESLRIMTDAFMNAEPEYGQVDRFEVHGAGYNERLDDNLDAFIMTLNSVRARGLEVGIMAQDNGRTLKAFVGDE